MHHIAIFASGSGSNAENIIRHFESANKSKAASEAVEISMILCNHPGAYVIQRAANLGVPCRLFTREDLDSGRVTGWLEQAGIDFIVLAGFLWKIPDDMISHWPEAIVNIHPALLPKHGGKGMFGSHVHEAVVADGDKESGITIHYVNGCYDSGDIIFQAKCPVLPQDSPEDVAKKVHALEYEHFPKVIESLLK